MSCSFQQDVQQNSDLAKDDIGIFSYDVNQNCILYFYCSSPDCYFDGLHLAGNRYLNSSDIKSLLSDYVIFMDTVQIYNVDSNLDSIGRIFISNPSNGNRIKFECYPLDNLYQITEAVILNSDVRFQGDVQIKMPKIEFYNTIKLLSFEGYNDPYFINNQRLCDTFCIVGDWQDTCKYIFRNNRLIKISYKWWEVLD
jgi:hypothetical protein